MPCVVPPALERGSCDVAFLLQSCSSHQAEVLTGRQHEFVNSCKGISGWIGGWPGGRPGQTGAHDTHERRKQTGEWAYKVSMYIAKVLTQYAYLVAA